MELLTYIHRHKDGHSTLRDMIRLGLDGYATLRHTAMAGRVDLVGLLVDTGMLDPVAEPRDICGETACDIAIRNGYPEVTKLLENEGFRVGEQNSLKPTAEIESEFDYLADILDEYTSPSNEVWEEGFRYGQII